MTYFREEYIYAKSTIDEVIDDTYFRRLLELAVIQRVSDYEYKFTFVGMLSYQRALIIVFPKFFKSTPDTDTLTRVIKVLKSCQRRIVSTYDVEWVDTDLNSNFPSELSICESLLIDYINYGFLKRKQEIEGVEVSGITNWSRTINETIPAFSKSGIVYFQTIETNYTDIHSNLLIKLHKWAIQYALKTYGSWLDFDEIVLDVDTINLEEIGNNEYLISFLNSQLNQSFLDQELKTISLIKQLISLEYNLSETNKFIYGTTSFHIVWELVCSEVFANQYHQLKHNIPSPKWIDNTGMVSTGSTLRPDLIIWDKEKSIFAILDAKYYTLEFGGGKKLYGNPGLEDISKQFLYLKSFEHFIKENQIDKIINVLLFPKGNRKLSVIEYLGKIEFNLFEGKEIGVVLISEKYLFEYFLSRKNIRIIDLLVLTKQNKESNKL